MGQKPSKTEGDVESGCCLKYKKPEVSEIDAEAHFRKTRYAATKELLAISLCVMVLTAPYR